MLDEPSEHHPGTVPDAVREFCSLSPAYCADSLHNSLFVDAMRELTTWHMERSPWYARYLSCNGVKPENLRTLDDIIAMPAVHANFFKAHEIRSIPLSEVTAHLTSSGTSGQKSQMFFDAFTLGGARAMVDRIMQERGFPSGQAANYLLNAYEPYEGFKVGTSNTNQFLMSYAPVAQQFWALRHIGQGRHEFDAFGAINALQEWARGETPVRIVGFPAFLFFTLERMQDMGVAPLRLPPGSWVVFGGGWKGHADQAISRDALAARIEAQLGIARANVIETFGSVEHSIPYVGCVHQRLHQPTWSRVVVRDVRTLQPVPDGTPGFLSFLSPYITSAPAHSVVMGDLAIRHPAGSCDCPAHATPWFEILGRAGVSTNRSCAAAAAELLQGHAA